MNGSWFRFSVHPAFRKAEPQPFSMSSLVRTAKPNFGATYKPENARLIPATPEGYTHHENGIYTHPDEGTHFVKKAMVHPDGPYGANNGANPHDLTRREYTAHKLYSYFSSPTNGILPVEAKLINGSGVEAPSGHQWKPDEPAWLVTRAASTKAGPSREVYGFDPRTADLAQGEADPEAMKATLHNLSRGAVVDAVLGSDKPWGTDIHAGSGNEGVFRIDVGGRLGIPSPFNEHDTATKTPQEYMEKRAPFFNPQTDVLQRTAEFLGGISKGFDPGENWGLSGLHGNGGSATPEEQDAWWKSMGHAVLGQHAEMAQRLQDHPDAFRDAIQHDPDPELLHGAIHHRVASLGSQLSAWKDNPEGLGLHMKSLYERMPLRKSMDNLVEYMSKMQKEFFVIMEKNRSRKR